MSEPTCDYTEAGKFAKFKSTIHLTWWVTEEVGTDGKDDSTGEMKMSETEGSYAQENNGSVGNPMETNSNDELLDQISVPPLAPEERIVSALPCNGGISYTTVAPSELGAVPEEDEEAATSSTPSTVVSSRFPIVQTLKKSLSYIHMCIRTRLCC